MTENRSFLPCFSSFLFLIFSLFSPRCFAFAVLIRGVLQKTKAQKSSVCWHHAWKSDILHIYFSYIFKNIHVLGFVHELLCVFGRAASLPSSWAATQGHSAEASHWKKLLQKSIPCLEQLWTILVTVSKCLKSSSGNVLLYNRVGPGMQQKASRDTRAWFKSQAVPPNNTFHGFRVPHLRILLLDAYS